jgi:hypothetical protein
LSTKTWCNRGDGVRCGATAGAIDHDLRVGDHEAI